jgi:hypothetical protein
MQHGYLIVEGPQDAELLASLLRPAGFHKVGLKREVDPFWNAIIPTQFPVDDDLLKRVPVPLFLQDGTHSIAIHSANGDSRIAGTLAESCYWLDIDQLGSVGLFLDADTTVSARKRFEGLCENISGENVQIQVPDSAGSISEASPRVGIYILPDNRNAGTLENILIDCAEENYSSLLASAEQFVGGVDRTALTAKDLQEIEKPAGNNKAIIGAVASILKPGKAIQVSLQDNRWFEGDAIQIPTIQSLRTFLSRLLSIQFEQ